MVKYGTRKYPETKLDGHSVKNTGRTIVVTSYTTWKEMADHNHSRGSTFIGTDSSVEGPKSKPIITYRVFEVLEKVKRRKK